MGVIRQKKGMFFTFVALFLIIIIVSIINTKSTYRYRDNANAVSSRVVTMNEFISDFEDDFQRELYIGGYRALLSMNSYIRQIQGYVDDFDSVFSEILVNGTANNTEMELMSQETQGASISSWLSRINDESKKLNIQVNLTVENITLVHTTPWDIELRASVNVVINDTNNLASWVFAKTYKSSFSIYGFEDPIYIVETKDKVTSLINVTPDTDFVDDATNDTTVLNNHLTNSFYAESDKAPSFLMRFSGNFSNSTYGIESMVNLEDLNAQGISLKNRSVIDYIYFGNKSTTDYCNVDNMPSWFRIDSGHIEQYEVDLLGKSLC